MSAAGNTPQMDEETPLNEQRCNLNDMAKIDDRVMDELAAIKQILRDRSQAKIVGVKCGKVPKILKIIEKYSTIVDIAIQQRPDITALVWEGVRLIIKLALNRFQTLECIDNAIETIIKTMSDLEFYERIYADLTTAPRAFTPQSTDKVGHFQVTLGFCLQKVYTEISICVDQVKNHFEKPGLLGEFIPFAVEFQPTLNDIVDSEKAVRKMVDQALMERIQVISKHLEDMSNYQHEMAIIMGSLEKKFDDLQISQSTMNRIVIDIKDFEKRREIFEYLFKGTTESRRTEIKGKRHEGTGKWLLDRKEFKDWMRGNSNPAILWAYGVAGVGKTYLSSIVIDHLLNYRSDEKHKTVGVAHIYFSYKEQDTQGLTIIFRSIIKQLGQQLAQLPAHLVESHTTWTRCQRTPTSEELLSALVKTSKLFTDTFIILDALDECDRQTQRETLLPILHRLGENGIKIFVTSRRYIEDIEIQFQGVSSIEIIAQNDDIASYIHHIINIYPSAKLWITDEEMKNDVVSRIVHAAGGMFLFISLNIGYLFGQTCLGSFVLELDKLHNAHTADKPMDPTYNRILGTIRNQPAERAKLAIRVLTWVVKAKRVLTIKELQTAVCLDEHITQVEEMDISDEATLIDICFGLVVMDGIDKTVRLAHFTAQEYLNRQDFIRNNSDTVLAIACTTYLSFDAFKKGGCSSEEEFDIRCNTHHLFKYAAGYLSFHLNSCDQNPTVEVLWKFLENKGSISSYHDALVRGSYQILVPSQPLPLLVASELGHAIMVNRLLKEGCDISTVDKKRLLTPLHLAANNGHQIVVDLLLSNGANPNALDCHKKTPLHRAASFGHLEVVRLLLDTGASVTAVDKSTSTPLHRAASCGHLEVVRLLLDSGADISAVDKHLITPLHRAASFGHFEVARLLVTTGANVTAVDKSTSTPLHRAVSCGHLEVVRLLLDTGADVSAVDKHMSTPLHRAASFGHFDVVRLLLGTGADVTAVDNEQMTPLHLAGIDGHVEVVRLLIVTGADVTAVDCDKRTLLHLAAIDGHLEVIRLLLDTGSDIVAVDNEMKTPLHWATIGGNVEVARLFIDTGADVTAVDNDEKTPLHYAATVGQLEMVRHLLDTGADVMAIDNEHQTPLHLAAIDGHLEVVRLLLGTGSDTSVVDNEKKTPLHWAAIVGHVEVVRLLLETGADVTAVDCDQRTSLHLAAIRGHLEVVQLLLDSGAEVTVVDNDTKIPLHWAAIRGNLEVVRLLLDTGSDVTAVDNGKMTPLHWAARYRHEDVLQFLSIPISNV